MIHDATVEVTCDNPRCRESVRIELPFNYPDYSGKGGRYDHRPHVVEKLLKNEGWTVVKVEGAEEGKHYCEGCEP